MNDLRLALSLLTALPVRAPRDPTLDAAPGRAMWAYPLAGGVIGILLLALAALMNAPGFARTAPLLAAALLLAAWCALTGALHLDGWADCCDALFVPVDRVRRLEILRDPRLGSFGGVGLVLLLLVKLAALQAILVNAVPVAGRAVWPAGSLLGAVLAGAGPWPSRLAALWPLLAAPVIARWCQVMVCMAYPLARPDGMAAYFRRGAGPRELVLGGMVVVLVALLGGWPAWLGWLAGVLVALALARLALARLGGLTGDVYGATVELVEVTVLVLACFFLGAS